MSSERDADRTAKGYAVVFYFESESEAREFASLATQLLGVERVVPIADEPKRLQ